MIRLELDDDQLERLSPAEIAFLKRLLLASQEKKPRPSEVHQPLGGRIFPAEERLRQLRNQYDPSGRISHPALTDHEPLGEDPKP